MNQEYHEDIIEHFEALLNRMKTETQEAIANKELKPRDELYARTTISGLVISERGVNISQESIQWIAKNVWFSGGAAIILDKVRHSKECDDLVSVIAELSDRDRSHSTDKLKALGLVLQFINNLIFLVLPDSNFTESDLQSYIRAYTNKVLDKPFPYWMEIQLKGIILLFHKIEVHTKTGEHYVLRQVRLEDFEKERPGYDILSGNDQSSSFVNTIFRPSVVLRIECIAKDDQGVLENARQVIGVLRLFKTGGVRVASHQLKSDINAKPKWNYPLSVDSIRDELYAFKDYIVREEESEKLVDFLRFMMDKIPKSFYKADVPIDFLTIAYERYCDALLHDNLYEKRIASVVMGLEALYLPTSPSSELRFRLSLNVSKLLGLMDFQTHQVKKCVTKAYDIRSVYAHGGQLSDKQESKLKKEYGDLNDLTHIVLNYLRISIVAFIILGMKKESLQILLEDSLVEKEREIELREKLSEVLKFI